MLLSLRFPSHSDPSAPAVMVWNFEVREDLQASGEHIGTAIVDQLVAEYSEREIYIGPIAGSVGFWERFRWPMCNCEECNGRNFIVRLP